MVTRGKGLEEDKYFKVSNNGKYMSEEESTVEDLYKLHKSGGNELQCSGGFYDAEAERRWKERAAEINAQRRLEKKIETKVYKRLIKELLKKI